MERPASVVKELIENSLDAGAGEIEVELESGGKRRIRVVDDGVGMGKDDALLAFDRHATSKIEDFEDLQRVGTLGFRGEALSSIAGVSKVEMVTAEEAGEGWRIRIEGGRVQGVEPAGRARGTTVEVSSLFWNVPARRKFLKRPRTELRRTVEVVQGYCLARPSVQIGLRHGGRTVLETVAVSENLEGRRERIRQLFGSDLVEDLHEIPSSDRERETIAGFVGGPATTKGRRIFLYVNDRLLRDRLILASFYRTVREVWKQDDFPALFLFLDVPPEEVDVNVHPQKAEVRFRDSSFPNRVREALRGGLLEARRESAAPVRDARRDFDRPLAWSGSGGTRERQPPGSAPASEVRERPGESGASGAASGGSPFSSGREGVGISRPRAHPEGPVRVPLSGEGDDSSVRILGQYKGALVLLEAEDALLLLDQHAAHERILYEKLSRSFSSVEPEIQRLLVPELLQLSTAERMQLEEIVEPLRELGFVVERLSGNDFALSGVPASLEEEEAVELILTLAGGTGVEEPDIDAVRRRILEELAAERACRGAIKIHRRLSMGQMEDLVESLFHCDDPYACPHGRPTLLEMTDADLERRFGRRG